jgi:hypothetical protein
MKFKLLLLLVGFIPALAMAEGHRATAPEKAPPVMVAKPAVVETHVYHYHHYHGMPGMMPPEMGALKYNG